MPQVRQQTERMSEELERIAAEHGSVLKPGDVIDFARDPETALHHRFEWDDGVAANKYRLWQARQLIAQVQISAPKMTGQTIRAFVSLSPERDEGGGYRLMANVLSDRDLREIHLRDALSDFQRLIDAYSHLDELGPLIASLRRAMKKFSLPEAESDAA